MGCRVVEIVSILSFPILEGYYFKYYFRKSQLSKQRLCLYSRLADDSTMKKILTSTTQPFICAEPFRLRRRKCVSDSFLMHMQPNLKIGLEFLKSSIEARRISRYIVSAGTECLPEYKTAEVSLISRLVDKIIDGCRDTQGLRELSPHHLQLPCPPQRVHLWTSCCRPRLGQHQLHPPSLVNSAAWPCEPGRWTRNTKDRNAARRGWS